MNLYLTESELKCLYKMVSGYISEFEFDDSPFVTEDDIKLSEKLKKIVENYDETEKAIAMLKLIDEAVDKINNNMDKVMGSLKKR